MAAAAGEEGSPIPTRSSDTLLQLSLFQDFEGFSWSFNTIMNSWSSHMLLQLSLFQCFPWVSMVFQGSPIPTRSSAKLLQHSKISKVFLVVQHSQYTNMVHWWYSFYNFPFSKISKDFRGSLLPIWACLQLSLFHGVWVLGAFPQGKQQPFPERCTSIVYYLQGVIYN